MRFLNKKIFCITAIQLILFCSFLQASQGMILCQGDDGHMGINLVVDACCEHEEETTQHNEAIHLLEASETCEDTIINGAKKFLVQRNTTTFEIQTNAFNFSLFNPQQHQLYPTAFFLQDNTTTTASSLAIKTTILRL